jgi:hypothetical protein
MKTWIIFFAVRQRSVERTSEKWGRFDYLIHHKYLLENVFGRGTKDQQTMQGLGFPPIKNWAKLGQVTSTVTRVKQRCEPQLGRQKSRLRYFVVLTGKHVDSVADRLLLLAALFTICRV